MSDEPVPKDSDPLTEPSRAFYNSITSPPDQNLFEAVCAYNNAMTSDPGANAGGREETLHRGLYSIVELNRRYPNGWNEKYLKWLKVGDKPDLHVGPWRDAALQVIAGRRASGVHFMQHILIGVGLLIASALT